MKVKIKLQFIKILFKKEKLFNVQNYEKFINWSINSEKFIKPFQTFIKNLLINTLINFNH